MERYNRETLRFERGGRAFYIKRHGAVGARSLWWHRLRYGKAPPAAREEWRAIEAMRRLGVATVAPVAYGVEEGVGAARRRSFVVTEDVGAALSLEAFGEGRLGGSPALRSALIDAVARIARRVHLAGWCHRDFYLCHFLWRLPGGVEAAESNAVLEVLEQEVATGREPELVLIDLHRMDRPRWARRRWIVKDVGSLWFSARGARLRAAERRRFVAVYEGEDGGPAGASVRARARFWRDVERRMRWVAGRRHR